MDEAYAMTAWATEKTDFVRAAAKFGATIVPFSSVGAAESAFFFNDIPLLADMASPIQNFLQTTAGARAPTNARYDSGKSNRIPFPLVVPKPFPSRHYFLFARPVELAGVIDYKDRVACEAMYRSIKQTIQAGCQDLIQASREDPFCDPLLRVPYEQFWQRRAPSFPISALN